MLTGDNKIVAEQIGNQLKIEKVISEVLPQDKEKEVSKLQQQGKKVAFVGDGLNDSPALVKADVGLAIGTGTDIAIDSADIVLMKSNLLDIVTAINLSKAVIKNIKMNLFWAFFYNCIGIPVACGIFYTKFGLKLNPMIGAAAMSLSSVCVVTNALRLRRFKPKFKSKIEKSIENKLDEKQIDKKQNINCKIDNKLNNNIEEELKMNKKIVIIEGMQCNHCKMSIEKALNSIKGITNIEVSLQEKKAIIESNINIDDNKIKEVIEEQGFSVQEIR